MKKMDSVWECQLFTNETPAYNPEKWGKKGEYLGEDEYDSFNFDAKRSRAKPRNSNEKAWK